MMNRQNVYKHIEYYLKNGEPENIITFAKALTLALEIMKSDSSTIAGYRAAGGKK